MPPRRPRPPIPPARRPSRAAVVALVIAAAAALGRLGPARSSAPADGAAAPPVVIAAIFPDGYAPGDADEAVQLWNVGAATVDLAGWALAAGGGRAVFPPGAALAPGAWAWAARDAAAFSATFGHRPDWAWGDAGDAHRGGLAVAGRAPRLVNTAGALWLVPPGAPLGDASGDAVAWRAAGTPAPGGPPEVAGWRGPPVVPYRTASIAGTGQVLYRKLDPARRRPVPDGDTAADWASDPEDPVLGRRARRPGWDLEAAIAPTHARGPASIALAIAPDGLAAFLERHVRAARWAIDLAAYSLEHPALARLLAERARAGLRVRVLVDGSPAGGHDPTGRWCLALLSEAGADVRFMDDGGDVRRRYRGAHAKLMVVDDRLALIGTENPTLASAPAGGAAGRRGAWLATDAPAVVGWARAVFDADHAPTAHHDLRPFQPRDPVRGAPAPDFTPAAELPDPTYAPRWGATLVTAGDVAWELVSAPENALDAAAGPLGLLARAGPGAVVRVLQLREPPWWGDGPAEGTAARNPRVQAYLAAARRGARVRVLLDAYFDDARDPRANAATAAWLNTVAARERLDLAAHLGNPTGRGIHAKLILVAGAEGDAWTHLGSLNGTEVSHKLNRELAVQLDAPAVHDRLAAVFDADWAASEARTAWLPRVGR